MDTLGQVVLYFLVARGDMNKELSERLGVELLDFPCVVCIYVISVVYGRKYVCK